MAEDSRCSDIVYSGGTLTVGTQYYWRIKFYDEYSTEGAWSATGDYFTCVSVDHYTVTAGTSQTAGDGFIGTVTAKDSSNNTIALASNAITVSNTGSAAFFIDTNYSTTTSTYTLSSGIATIYVLDETAETLTISAVDAATKVGTSAEITIAPDEIASWPIDV